jgi:glycosyltransferase involved in cell wall biosynthesis
MISVVIPTYNEEKNIERCLSALNEQSPERADHPPRKI